MKGTDSLISASAAVDNVGGSDMSSEEGEGEGRGRGLGLRLQRKERQWMQKRCSERSPVTPLKEGMQAQWRQVGASLSRLTSKPKTYLGRQMISRREYK